MQEDQLLKALIQEHGPKKWSLISSIIKSKSSKQCRRRWKNVLDMDAKATEWTQDEDARLVKYHREMGNKWTQISQLFGDRTDNAVKNRWHALCRKQPELAEEDSPVTTIGVKRGTRTRLQTALSDDTLSGRTQRKRRREGSGLSNSGVATVSGHISSMGNPPRQNHVPPMMPTPFDQQQGPPLSLAPLSFIVQKASLHTCFDERE